MKTFHKRAHSCVSSCGTMKIRRQTAVRPVVQLQLGYGEWSVVHYSLMPWDSPAVVALPVRCYLSYGNSTQARSRFHDGENEHLPGHPTPPPPTLRCGPLWCDVLDCHCAAATTTTRYNYCLCATNALSPHPIIPTGEQFFAWFPFPWLYSIKLRRLLSPPTWTSHSGVGRSKTQQRKIVSLCPRTCFLWCLLQTGVFSVLGFSSCVVKAASRQTLDGFSWLQVSLLETVFVDLATRK